MPACSYTYVQVYTHTHPVDSACMCLIQTFWIFKGFLFVCFAPKRTTLSAKTQTKVTVVFTWNKKKTRAFSHLWYHLWNSWFTYLRFSSQEEKSSYREAAGVLLIIHRSGLFWIYMKIKCAALNPSQPSKGSGAILCCNKSNSAYFVAFDQRPQQCGLVAYCGSSFECQPVKQIVRRHT